MAHGLCGNQNVSRVNYVSNLQPLFVISFEITDELYHGRENVRDDLKIAVPCATKLTRIGT
jgi:hypothetical protein